MVEQQPDSQRAESVDPQGSEKPKSVWFFVEHRQGKVEEASLRLAAEARNLADRLKGAAAGIVVGRDLADIPPQLGPYGTDYAILIDDQRLETYSGETYVEVLTQLAVSETPSIALFAVTALGNDLAPRLAARLRTGFVGRYTEIDVDRDATLNIRKAIHGGNASATFTAVKTPLVATIDTQTLTLQKAKAPVETRTVEPSLRIPARTSRTRVIDWLKADPCAVCVSEAEIVIGIGKGLGGAGNLPAIEQLAQVLGASIGGSRRATDEKWIADERRIGMTGKTIAPRLYLICGISGAFHHTLSIKSSQLKVVINTDEKAPIGKMADLMVIGDMQQIVPELTRQLNEMAKK
jgi:electron transfer flavoprotein alpha subunit